MALYIVGTPIGHLDDITMRALQILRDVDFVIAEDSRHTKKLLSAYEISKPIVSLHMHSTSAEYGKIVDRLRHESAALVTDAGTPGIADPGGLLIEALAQTDVRVVPIPGPSAITAALSVAGMRANQFAFMGYVPHKKGRRAFFAELEQCRYTVVCFETPHRIGKTLEALAAFKRHDRVLMIGRELTKIHETIYRGRVADAVDMVPQGDFRGEFVIVVEGS